MYNKFLNNIRLNLRTENTKIPVRNKNIEWLSKLKN